MIQADPVTASHRPPLPAASAPDPQPVDVLVIGGGPAGTTAATLLARNGWKVVLLEKGVHPRFHIGESLLPMNLPILDRLGVLEQVQQIGVLKPGADFPMQDDGSSVNVFRFDRALNPVFGHAYQVKREEFDHLLFRNAVDNGVDARMQVTVESVEFGADGRPPSCMRAVRAACAVVRATLLLSQRPRHFPGRAAEAEEEERAAPVGGDLQPFPRCHPPPGARRGQHHRRTLRPRLDVADPAARRCDERGCGLLPRIPEAAAGRQRLALQRGLPDADAAGHALGVVAHARRRAHRTGPRHRQLFYSCSRMTGPGWVMVGDAYAFIDPVFSSGVYLGMNSGEHAAGVVDGALREPASEARLQQGMERRLKRGLRHFSWFIYRFTTPVMQRLFANPRNHFQVEQAVISMLAGDVFDNRAVLRRLRLFRMIYAFNALQLAPRAFHGWLRRKRQVGESFGGDTLQEGNP